MELDHGFELALTNRYHSNIATYFINSRMRLFTSTGASKRRATSKIWPGLGLTKREHAFEFA
ncbi:hypothetical protein [Nitrosomonas communis]|uniref:hypothetical protein n=1 Tax=Nitrosomonas communis TaxID=44574 RepID=UPI0009446678|nr:hypothetical protein [Nitrosomonas communis]